MKTSSRRISTVVAACLAICLVLLGQTPLTLNTLAQNATYRVESNSDNGLYVSIFSTPHGKIRVNLPNDMTAGDAVSGSIYTEPAGKDETERNANLSRLNGYVIDLSGQRTTVGDKTFTHNVRGPLNVVLIYQGERVATSTVPLLSAQPPTPMQFTLPTAVQQGRLFQVRGPFNGTFSQQDFVKVGGTQLPLIAESPRSLIVHNTSELVGQSDLNLFENGVAVGCPFRNVSVSLSAPKLNLIRGEKTTLQVTVTGLGGLTGDHPLELQNQSPGVITMSGGEQQRLTIRPSEIRSDGTYSTQRTLTGIMAGGFGVTATLRWTEECQRPTNQPSATGGRPSGRTKLDEGRALLNSFKFYAALDPLNEALKSYNTAGDQNGVGVTSDALGDLYLEEGQYEVALRYFEAARQAFLKGNETVNANLMLSKIGETYLLLDNNTRAKSVFSQVRPQPSNPTALTDSERHKAFFAFARSKLGEGRADSLLGQLGIAEADFKDLLAAASLAQNAGYQEAARFRVAAATNLGDVLFRKGDLVNARLRYDEAIQLARRDRRNDLEWAAKAGLARTLWSMSRQTTRRLNKDLRPDRRAAHASVQRPENTSQLQTDARNAYRDALAGIETIGQAGLRNQQARKTFLATSSQVFNEAAAVNAEVALAGRATIQVSSTGASSQFAAEGFRIAEAGRARSLLDVLADGRAEISSGVPPELIRRRRTNLANQQLLGTQLTGVSITGETPKQSVVELERELERLAVELESIENQIRVSNPRYQSLVQTRSLTLSDVQQQILDDDTALLEYSLGDENSYLWVVTREGVSLFKLPAASTLDQLAIDLRAQIIPPRLQRRNVGIDVVEHRGLGLSPDNPSENTAAFLRASNALYKVAIAPAASLVTNRRLIIVADGALNFIPFEALVATDRGGDYSSLDYLVKTNRISYAPSASVIAAMRNQRRTAGRDILLIADPIFSATDPRLQNRPASTVKLTAATRGLGLDSAVTDATGQSSTSTDPIQFSRLAGTRIEAEQIARLTRSSGAQADLWLDLAANEDEVKTREIQRYRVLHVATHGILDAMRPQFSGLVLSQVGNKNDEDGFLRTSEIFNVKLGVPLVMLSACETGLGKVKRGEGVMGLTRAFMYAGSPTVGVTLWSVADKPTAELMTEFYRHYLGPNSSPSTAMREAQLAMISGKKYSSPFYWAPFVLVGDWK